MKNILVYITTIGLIIILLVGGVFLGWFGTWFGNKVNYVNKKIDDATNYTTIKKVEDTCRSMIASYKTDKSTYELYIASENEEKQSWAEQAKMRANKTANTYNEYILKNSFVWQGNVPSDIDISLQLIK